MSLAKDYRVSRVAICYFYINKLLGLVPITYDNKTKEFKTSFLSLLYPIFAIIAMIILYYHLLCQYLIFLNKFFSSPIAKFISAFQSLYLCLEIISVQFIYICYRKLLVQYLNGKREFEIQLNLVSKKIYKKNYYAHLSLFTAVIFGLKILFQYFLLLIFNSVGGQLLTSLIFYMIPYAAGTLIGTTFSMEVISLRFLAVQINYTLMDSLKTIRNLPEDTSKAHRMTLSCDISDKVDKLMTLHSRLNTMIRKFNCLQNIALLFYYTYKFMDIIIPIFYEYLYITGHSKIQSSLAAYFFAVIEEGLNALELVVTVFSSQELINEMRKTGRILHEFPVHQTDSRLKESIYRFSTQILQENRPISIFGMFTVDNTLLYAMVSAMTSYLILLIQFQQQEIIL
ncbi:hypothetical protein DMENIID0001_046720 [Sergentomyia squamirostris]